MTELEYNKDRSDDVIRLLGYNTEVNETLGRLLAMAWEYGFEHAQNLKESEEGIVSHTPGPWMLPHFATPNSECDCGYVLHENYMGCIAEVKYSIGDDISDNPPRPEAEANARLIAAAPDLLVALSWLLGEFREYMDHPDRADTWPEAMQQAEWAIAKAKKGD